MNKAVQFPRIHKRVSMGLMAPWLTLKPFVRPGKTPLIAGAAAAIGVVVLRLALPWPFRSVLEPLLAGAGATVAHDGLISWMGNSSVWMAGAAFCLIVAALGWADHWERLNFARFAIGMVKNLRSRAYRRINDEASSGHEHRRGDLIARLVGDAARIKAGLKGFLVHVATNLLMFIGVVLILLWIDLFLGLVFAIAGGLTVLATLTGAKRIYRCARRHRRKEGKMADAIQAAETDVISDKEFSRINSTSEHYEARVTRLQGQTTWAAHTILGITVLAALLVGWRGYTMGRLTSGDLFICMAYMLMLRAPLVQLTRQGARTGKISAALERVMGLVEDHPHRASPVHRPPGNWRRIRMISVKIKATKRYGRHRKLGPIDLVIEKGEQVAVVGPPGAGKSTLLSLIAGKVRHKKGAIEWETDTGTRTGESSEAPRKIAFSPEQPVWNRRHLGNFLGIEAIHGNQDDVLQNYGLASLLKRFPDGIDSHVSSNALSMGERKLVSAVHVANCRAAIKMIDDPTALFSKRHASDMIRRLLRNTAGDTILISLSRANGMSEFDRIIKLRRGKIVFDGTPDQLRQSKLEKKQDLHPLTT